MTLPDFIARFQSAKQDGEFWRVKCPAHDDHNPSLSVWEKDGKIMLKCFTGCENEAVVSSMGLTFKDLVINPDTNTKPKKQKFNIVATYPYHYADGTLAYEVCRLDPKDFRQRVPEPGAPHGYKWKMNGVQRVLYRLPVIQQRIESKLPIILVEGEKDADNLAAIGIPAATTNVGGAGKWLPAYTDALRDAAQIFIIPDNDDPGRQHAQVVHSALPHNSVIVTLPGLPQKGDVSDFIKQFSDHAEAKNAIRELCAKAWRERDTTPAPAPKPATPENAYFTALGFDQGRYFFLSNITGQIVDMTPCSMARKENLYQLAPLAYWESLYAGDKGVQWTVAIETLMHTCHIKGLFDDRRRRGRGAWLDSDRVVLHQGEDLIVDGKQTDLLSFTHTSSYYYEKRHKLSIPYQQPLHTEACQKLVELTSLLNWEHPDSARLLAGWLVIAPICGVLAWRPHIWVTGPRGCGKTWVLESLASPLIGPMAVQVQGSTTEAGLRQLLQHDARPILFDEAGDSADERSQMAMQRVIELARQSSSDSGSVIAKGTTGGGGMQFHMRSAFMLASIAPAIKRAADESRITTLHLKKGEGGPRFEAIQRLAAEVCTADYSAGLIARSCGLASTIRRNAETFAIAVDRRTGSRRTGDQLGALLAGVYSLWSDEAATLDQAADYISGMRLDDLTPPEEADDGVKTLHILLAHTVKTDENLTFSIGDLADFARGATPQCSATIIPSKAADMLRRHGFGATDEGLIVSNSHTGVAKIVDKTLAAGNWGVLLKRLPGTKLTHTIRFGGGVRTRGVVIPWETIVGEDEREDSYPATTESEEPF